MKNDFELLPDGTVKVFLTQGQFTIIDLDSIELIATYRWHAVKSPRASKLSFYARTGKVKMHSLINSTPKGFVTDHENGNTLDNRRSNLRTATYAQNQRNGTKYKNNKSGYKGVCWTVRHSKWMASIKINGRNKTLGYFTDKVEAAKAYNSAAIQYHKNFAQLNSV